MTVGGADRDRVLDIVGTNMGSDAESILIALEDHGYAVVRAGQVPSIDPLVDVQGRLDLLARRGGGVQHDPGKAQIAVTLLSELRRLACEVLAIDPAVPVTVSGAEAAAVIAELDQLRGAGNELLAAAANVRPSSNPELIDWMRLANAAVDWRKAVRDA